MPKSAANNMLSNRTRVELRRFGAQCFYSFMVSAVTTFVLCALAPAKAVHIPATPPDAQPVA